MHNPFDDLLPAKEAGPKKNHNYFVCGMYTPSYAHKAIKLENSLKKFDLPYALFEIPSIHSSISRHGVSDSPFRKAKLILSALNRYKLPILYLDVDCEIVRKPNLIFEIASKNKDFGIFNWLSRERNDAYRPVNLPGFDKDRFFSYSHGICFLDESQLICSGAVQYWGNTPVAKNLLLKWDLTVEENPNSADDKSLDYSFNNNPERNLIKTYWLPKSYARYGFWIFDKPIINHSDMPDTGYHFQPIKLTEGQFLLDEGSIKKKPEYFHVPPNLFLDSVNNDIVSIQNGIPVKVKKSLLGTYISRS